MWLVHDSKGDLGGIGIFCSYLTPEACELCVCWSALTDNTSVPARIIMDIDDASCTSPKTRLNELIILGKVRSIQYAPNYIVGEILPSYREPEKIEVVIFDKMRHLSGAIFQCQPEDSWKGKADEVITRLDHREEVVDKR